MLPSTCLKYVTRIILPIALLPASFRPSLCHLRFSIVSLSAPFCPLLCYLQLPIGNSPAPFRPSLCHLHFSIVDLPAWFRPFFATCSIVNLCASFCHFCLHHFVYCRVTCTLPLVCHPHLSFQLRRWGIHRGHASIVEFPASFRQLLCYLHPFSVKLRTSFLPAIPMR